MFIFAKAIRIWLCVILSSPPEIAKFYETNRMIGGSCKQARINLSFRRVFASLGWYGLSSCLFCEPYKAAVRSMSDIKASGTAWLLDMRTKIRQLFYLGQITIIVGNGLAPRWNPIFCIAIPVISRCLFKSSFGNFYKDIQGIYVVRGTHVISRYDTITSLAGLHAANSNLI